MDRTKETPHFWSQHWRECLGGWVGCPERKEVESPEAGSHLESDRAAQWKLWLRTGRDLLSQCPYL